MDSNQTHAGKGHLRNVVSGLYTYIQQTTAQKDNDDLKYQWMVSTSKFTVLNAKYNEYTWEENQKFKFILMSIISVAHPLTHLPRHPSIQCLVIPQACNENSVIDKSSCTVHMEWVYKTVHIYRTIKMMISYVISSDYSTSKAKFARITYNMFHHCFWCAWKSLHCNGF